MKKIKEIKILKTEQKRFHVMQGYNKYMVEGGYGRVKRDVNIIRVLVLEAGMKKTGVYFFMSNKDQQTFLTNLRMSIKGVLSGFGKELLIKGIGYKVWKVKNKLYFKLGFSHWLQYDIPSDLIVRGKKNRLIVFGAKKEKVGLVSDLLRSIKEPDVYKGKGIQYLDENLILKVGKQRQR